VNKQRDVRTALELETKTLVGWPALSEFLHSNKGFVNMEEKKSGKKHEIHIPHDTYEHTLYSTDLTCHTHW
jgi:hypothetical protein